MKDEETSCAELVELLTDYLEAALSLEQVEAVEAHLAGCRGCAGYVAQMRSMIAELGRLTVDTLPPELVDDLLAAFRDRRR